MGSARTRPATAVILRASFRILRKEFRQTERVGATYSTACFHFSAGLYEMSCSAFWRPLIGNGHILCRGRDKSCNKFPCSQGGFANRSG
jgi:hypothetical protein